MISINITLGYFIIHLLCVLYIFNMFNSESYDADEIEKILVWIFAPEFLLMVWVLCFLKERRK